MRQGMHGGGWTSFDNIKKARGTIPVHLVGGDSTLLEIYAYLATVKALVSVLKTRTVLIRTDSQAGAAIMRKGDHMRIDYNNLFLSILTVLLVIHQHIFQCLTRAGFVREQRE
eukprot:Lithocolla_globosa_v1_NODE_748_length_3337_cov_38.897623.p3 type:complete len:113 gc:universal NODE_748_length_3337_cov_38.897623:1869-1531(-)